MAGETKRPTSGQTMKPTDDDDDDDNNERNSRGGRRCFAQSTLLSDLIRTNGLGCCESRAIQLNSIRFGFRFRSKSGQFSGWRRRRRRCRRHRLVFMSRRLARISILTVLLCRRCCRRRRRRDIPALALQMATLSPFAAHRRQFDCPDGGHTDTNNRV